MIRGGIRGLRNLGPNATQGQLFRPSDSNTRQETIDFRLDLGAQVTAVVPQPIQRVNGQLQQLRDTVVVYFDSDKLLVENDSLGRPTERSVENPAFYQLIFTDDTVRNTDDIYFTPSTVRYNASANTATLRFASDINDLIGSNQGPATFRLRIGTRESAPITPTYSEAAANVISDLNTNGALKLRLTARQVGEAGNGIQVEFLNSGTGTPVVTAAGRTVRVDMGRADLTGQELLALIQNSSAASALVSASFEPGSDPSTVVGNRGLAYSPLTLLGLGSSFDTATNLGKIGSSLQLQTSLVLGSSIDPESYVLDLPGASDDPGHRVLPQSFVGSFEDHINSAFGADRTAGITTSITISSLFLDAIVRIICFPMPSVRAEAAGQRSFEFVGKYIGVQFVESADLGLTIATGPLTGVRTQVVQRRCNWKTTLALVFASIQPSPIRSSPCPQRTLE